MDLSRAISVLALVAAALALVAASSTGTVGYIEKFTCGKLYYRTLHLDTHRELLFVGAMGKIFRLNLQNISNADCKDDSLTLDAPNVRSCVSKGKTQDYDCKNHVRVIQPMGDGTRLYICGTNAHSPKDYVIYFNLTDVPKSEAVPGIGDGIAKCPFDPDDNSTAVWVEKGNPGGLPALYSGTVAEFTKADTVIFRTDLYNKTTGQKAYNFKRTIKYDSKWLDKPNFVGSFEIGEYVFFFFRETAVEYINCGKSVYSRIARICKMDTGGKNILNQNWATFLKARLNCSIPGEFPFYFNEIQSVYKLPDDDTRFYATFTTSMNGLIGSAICSFTLRDIQETFNWKFKEQETSSSAWLPVLSSKVPEPRPGQCVNDTQTLPDTVLNFIRGHPLMDGAVPHEYGKPVFYKRDLVFLQLVVDRVDPYTVYYAGSNDGKIYKIVEWYKDGRSYSRLQDVLEATSSEPIRALQISSQHKSLYVASDEHVWQINLANVCAARYVTCVQCVQDPYCGWDVDRSVCRAMSENGLKFGLLHQFYLIGNYQSGLLQDVPNVMNRCEECVHGRVMHVHWGQSLHLSCAVTTPSTLMSNQIRWYRSSAKGVGELVDYRAGRFVETSSHGLVILSVNENDGGHYDCKMGMNSLCSYNVTVNTKTCSAPNESQYRLIYSDWCKEFEKYKALVQKWESQQLSCQRKNHQNLHSNDVNFHE